MLTFGDPFYFFLLLPAAAAAWFIYRRRVRAGIIFSAVSRCAQAGATWRVRASQVLPLLFLAGLVLAIVALARPRTVFSKTRRTTDVVAIQMVVDISGSMEALDLSIRTATGMDYRTRLEAVKEAFAEFVARRPDDLIGLVTFGGYASTRAPLTTDHDALVHVLDGIEVPKPYQDGEGRILNQEELLTAIGDGLATAVARMQDTDVKSRIVVLLSDGESNTGIIEPEQAVEAARELDIKVYTIGVGRTGRAPFKARDLFGRDTIRHAHVSLDETLLRKIATDTGARYYNVSNPKGLEKTMAEINELEKTEVEREEYLQYNELFPWFLGPSLCLVLLGTGLNMMMARRIV